MRDSVKFLLIIFTISLVYNYIYIFDHIPYSMHQWRQTDALSITLNYFKEGMVFFEPKIHLQQGIQGRAVGEFPIIYYMNAAIWFITGENYTTPRLINFAIVVTGLVSLFKIGMHFFKDFFFAGIAPLLLFASPIFVFYTNNFILNVPAISFVFIGWNLFINYQKDTTTKQLIYSIMAFSFAGLLRTTMIMGYTPLLLIVFLEHFNIIKTKNAILHCFKHKLLLLTPIILIGAWIIWIKSYNNANDSIYFLTTINPIWGKDGIEIIWDQIINDRMQEFYPSFIVIFFVIATLYFLINIKRLNNYLAIAFITMGGQISLYFLLWYHQFDVHDYYYIDYYLYTTTIVMVSIYFIKTNYPQLFTSKSIQYLGGIFFIVAITYCAVISRTRYRFNDNFITRLCISNDRIEQIKYEKWDYGNKFKAIETIRPYLRSLGITREDKVVSLPDRSSNITLYFMDQKGYTKIYNWNSTTEQIILESIEKGAKFLIVSEQNLLKENKFIDESYLKIGQYKTVSIYKLK